MSFLNGITLLLIYQLVGEATVLYLKLPVPGPVMGMVLLFVTLLIRNQTPESLETASSALLSHLPLLFVPAGVGMMVHFQRIGNEWLSISLAIIVSTVVTLVLTALIMQGCQKLLTKSGDDDA